jgi:hypothetical protein
MYGVAVLAPYRPGEYLYISTDCSYWAFIWLGRRWSQILKKNVGRVSLDEGASCWIFYRTLFETGIISCSSKGSGIACRKQQVFLVCGQSIIIVISGFFAGGILCARD